MASDDVRIAGDGLVRLIDGIASHNDGVSFKPGLRIDDRIASDDYSASVDAARDIEAAEEDKNMAREITLHLNGAEEANSIVDLLPLGDEDVLIEVGAVSPRLSQGCSRKREKQQREHAKRFGEQGFPRRQHLGGSTRWFGPRFRSFYRGGGGIPGPGG